MRRSVNNRASMVDVDLCQVAFKRAPVEYGRLSRRVRAEEQEKYAKGWG